MALGISAHALGRALGVSHVAVLGAAKSGRISRLSDGSFDKETATREWSVNTDTSKARNLVTGNPGGEKKNGNGIAASATRSQIIDSIQRSRALKEHWAARKQKVETEEIEGLTIRREEVEREFFEQFRRVRDKLLAMPDRVGPVIAGISDIPIAIKTMREEIMLILEELSSGVYQK